MLTKTLEIDLLLSCCNPLKMIEIQDKINHLLEEEINWEILLNLAKNHGVTCILAKKLKEIKCSKIPPNIISFLDFKYRENTHKNLKFKGELLRLIKLFNQHQISVINFKGVVLAELTYHNLALREFEDLDLLIKQEKLIIADDLLKKEGYLPQVELNEKELNIYQKLRSEFIYWHPKKDITIDLHWRLLPRYFSFSDSVNLIEKNQQKVLLNNHKILTLNNEINLLFLCSHGAKHDWLYLCWIVDLATYINENQNLDWQKIINNNGDIATSKMILIGLNLVNSIFKINLPKNIIQLIEKDIKIEELSNKIKANLFTEKEIKKGYIMPEIYLETFDNYRDKIWFWIDTIMTPTVLELNLISLPQILFILYYPLRLIRLIYKYLLPSKN